MKIHLAFILATGIALAAGAQEHHADCSMHHASEVDQRHDTLGMQHDAATHSFRLFADGGAIELRANKADDQTTVAAIRTHLEEIAQQFAKSDFSTPAFVHGHAPDGVAAMKRLARKITYRYEPLPNGARVRITSANADAIAAVHDFLRFQIAEHHTANSGKVEEDQ